VRLSPRIASAPAAIASSPLTFAELHAISEPLTRVAPCACAPPAATSVAIVVLSTRLAMERNLRTVPPRRVVPVGMLSNSHAAVRKQPQCLASAGV
jgi:hypothetical protein